MPIGDDWKYETIDSMALGINGFVRPEALQSGELVTADNIVFDKFRAKIDTGYIKFGGATRGIPRAQYVYVRNSGASELLLITDSTFYVWAASEWQYVSDGNATTCSDGEPAGETNIVVAAIAGFSDADFIGIILDDGTQHQTTINGAPAGTTIVITDAIPVGRTVSVGAALLKAVDLAGSVDLGVSVVTIPSHDWMVFTNGVDVPRFYESTECKEITNLAATIGANGTCQIVTLFNNHLVLMNMSESGTKYPQRVRRADTADPTNWTTANSGYEDLYGEADVIVAAKSLGPYIIVYRDKSISRMSYEASAIRLFSFETVVSEKGSLNLNSVIDVGDYHIVYGISDIYRYQGGFSLDPIGQNIYHQLFSTASEVNAANRHKMFGIYLEELDQVWFLYPALTSTEPNKAVKYHLRTKTWSFRKFSNSFMGFGLYTSTTSKKWNELVGAWADQTWVWQSQVLNSSSPTLLLGDNTDQVYEYDFVAGTDDGTAISYTLETKEFTNVDGNLRIDSAKFKGTGTSILVEYTIDEGVNWLTYDTISPGTSPTIVDMFKQIVTERIRWRFSGAGGGFSVDWFQFKFKFESEY